jgi:hypothetical protein
LNTPNGSWGIVQVQPKSTQFFVLPEYNWKSFKHKTSAAKLLVESICQVYRLGNAARTDSRSPLGVSASLPALLSH